MSQIVVPADQIEAVAGATTLPCVTQDPRERMLASSEYLEVCTGVGEHVVNSVNCGGTGCGGHMICTPCRDLALSTGWLLASA
jgi:hypothetical protein